MVIFMVERLCHIPDESISDGITLELSIYGNPDPTVGNTETYNWKLIVQGNKNWDHLRDMVISFSFVDEDGNSNLAQIIGYEPLSKTITDGTVQVSTPQQIVTYSKSIEKKEKIISQEGENDVKWTFKEISLKEDPLFKYSIPGRVEAIFLRESYGKNIRISMDVASTFARKKLKGYYTENCPNSPKIEYKKVVEECKIITSNFYGVAAQKTGEEFLDYHFDKDTGILYKGGIRNVSLRAESFAKLFYRIKETEKGRQAIKAAGKDIGINFISKFSSEILMKNLSLEEKIKKWIDYDSSAGMGKFVLEGKTNLKVYNSFNAVNFAHERKPMCCFLEGYFEGILCQLYGGSISVKETNCAAMGGDGGNYCIFEIKEEKSRKRQRK
jgi:predicted hydrocarbon binding protein